MAKYISVICTAMLILTACGSAPQPEAQDLLLVQSGGSLALVGSSDAATTLRANSAVPSRDWSTVVSLEPNGSQTKVVAVDPGSGSELWSRPIQGNMRIKAVSEDGRLVALGPTGEGYYATGRARTKLVILGADLEPRTIRLRGNLEPEAFSTDGSSLFVLRYEPARSPARYQVRRLDLATNKVEGVYTPDAQLQESMKGTARIQAVSPDGRYLYTLYTTVYSGREHAFIHVLNLDEQWAHCIDLPDDWAGAPEFATSLAVAPTGDRLAAINANAGVISLVDTRSLGVIMSDRIDIPGGGRVQALYGTDGLLYVARGSWITVIDTATMAVADRWEMAQAVTGLQIGEKASQLYVGLRNRIAIVDALSGVQERLLDPPNIGRIDRFGPLLPSLDEVRSNFICAC